MNQIKRVINQFKKEKIFRNINVKKQQEEVSHFFESIETKYEYHILDFEMTSTFVSKLKGRQIDNRYKAISNGALYFDIESDFDAHISYMKAKFHYIENTVVLLLPRKFLNTLSVVITTHDLFSNLERIMEFFDDDLDIHEYDFSNSLFITADRIGSKITNLELVQNGVIWKRRI